MSALSIDEQRDNELNYYLNQCERQELLAEDDDEDYEEEDDADADDTECS